MREGDIAVMADNVAGTVISVANGEAWILTKALYIYIIPIGQLYPIQEGQTLNDDEEAVRFNNREKNSKLKRG